MIFKKIKASKRDITPTKIKMAFTIDCSAMPGITSNATARSLNNGNINDNGCAPA